MSFVKIYRKILENIKYCLVSKVWVLLCCFVKPIWLILALNLFCFYRGLSKENVPPHEASDRLQIFQAKFNELWRKYISLSGGEELFGLPITGSFSGDTDTWS